MAWAAQVDGMWPTACSKHVVDVVGTGMVCVGMDWGRGEASPRAAIVACANTPLPPLRALKRRARNALGFTHPLLFSIRSASQILDRLFRAVQPPFRSVYKELHADRETGC